MNLQDAKAWTRNQTYRAMPRAQKEPFDAAYALLQEVERLELEADTNAPWLSSAHCLCTDYGIQPGEIGVRIELLRKDIRVRIGFLRDAVEAQRERADKLSVTLSDQTMCYDPDSRKQGLLDALEIAKEEACEVIGCCCLEIVEAIKAKAEAMK
jgi:hypothetical protein